QREISNPRVFSPRLIADLRWLSMKISRNSLSECSTCPRWRCTVRKHPEMRSHCAACRVKAPGYRTCMESRSIPRTSCSTPQIGVMSATTGLREPDGSKILRILPTHYMPREMSPYSETLMDRYRCGFGLGK